MKKLIFIVAIFFISCAPVKENINKIKSFSKCYIEKIPAPFWVCYQSNFMSVGKVYADKPSRLKQEEAYSIALEDLITKLQLKTKKLLKKANIENDKILDEVKNFVLVNAIEGSSWYDKKHHMLYVEAKVDKEEFKKFLESKLKIKNFKKLFNETF